LQGGVDCVSLAAMPNLNSVINEQISRLARREIRAQTKKTKKLTAQYRRDIASLKRQIAALSKSVAFLTRQEKRRVGGAPVAASTEASEGVRFRADGLKSHRAKLGLSAADYGRLVGASGLSVYHWEGGKARPRRPQVAKLAAVRGIGKREALKRLEMLGGGGGGAGGGGTSRRRRRAGGPSAQDFVLALVKGKRGATSKAINDAWRKAGRPGKADNTLSIMVRGQKLKRAKLEGERGSSYQAA